MKRLAGIILLGVLSAGCLAQTSGSAMAHPRDSRKAEKQQQKAQKKYAKAQKKAERKMLKTEKKGTKYPKQQF
jgi:enterochelin esterase-like enzyme